MYVCIIYIANALHVKMVSKFKFKSKLKIRYKMCSEAVLQKRCSANTRKPQKNNYTDMQFQESCFATLLKSHPHMDAPVRIHSTPTEHLSSREHLSPEGHLWGAASVCQKSFKRLKL